MKLFKNAREVLKTVKYHRPTMIFCPKCCSPDLKSYSGFGGIDMWLTPRKYVCEKCGYVGPIYMILEKEESS